MDEYDKREKMMGSADDENKVEKKKTCRNIMKEQKRGKIENITKR